MCLAGGLSVGYVFYAVSIILYGVFLLYLSHATKQYQYPIRIREKLRISAFRKYLSVVHNCISARRTPLTFHWRLSYHCFWFTEIIMSCLLDLSPAFDTIDHDILLNRILSWLGTHGTALKWFKSYLSSRTFWVKCDNNFSSCFTSLYGVP